ncbi:histidine phosphatase family protein, partial [Kineococcus glutinatus]|uniref:histidine phosphatase family protein n=1 Tax=Kineococcus glutinatus TaxID=1070872 RepID=UPI0031E6EB98
MAAGTVVLWRHGRTGFNAARRFQGQLDIDLDAVGREQVAASAAVLARLRPAAVVASDLLRAAATAKALAERTGLPLELDAGLREVDVPAGEGLGNDEVAARWPQEHAAWRRGEDVPMGGGERRSEAGARAAAAVER